MFLITQRQGLIVWFQHMKNLKHIKRYGNLIYASRKRKYAVLYVDQKDIDTIEQKILRHSFVSRVDRSYKPFVRTDFENSKKDDENDNKYDYKMGI